MGTQKLYQISFSSADAKAALKTLIPAMESGFNVNTHRGDFSVSGEDAAAVAEFLAERIKARLAVEKGAEKQASFKSDIPAEHWLEEKLRWVREGGRNEWGVPKTFGPITGSFSRPLILPVELLQGVPGERGEQGNVRQKSLEYIRANFEKVTEDPIYVEVDPFGKAWVSEGNHRIMVAAEKGVSSLPTQVRYFTGAERIATDFSPERLMNLDAEMTKGAKAAKGKEQPAVVTREQARFMGFNTDTALGKYTAIVKLEEGMSDRDARSDAISMMRASFGGVSAVRVGDEARLLAEIPEGAWEDKNCLGWGWMVKGHLPELVAEKQFPQSPKFLFITIDNAQTAAFADIGRNNEVRRILSEAADYVLAHGIGEGIDLHDTNGNVVGRLDLSADSMVEPLELPSGGIRVVLDLSSAAFDDGINRDVDIAAAIDMAAKRFDVLGAGTHFLLVNQDGVAMGAVGQSLPDAPERAPAADDSHLAM